jgi:hypothetical protein
MIRIFYPHHSILFSLWRAYGPVLLPENRFPIKADSYPQGRAISGILFITGYEKVSMAGMFTGKDENKGILFLVWRIHSSFLPTGKSGIFFSIFRTSG